MFEETNHVYVSGEMLTLPSFSHCVYGEKFMNFSLGVNRLSGNEDELPILISERILPKSLNIGTHLSIVGQIRSYNQHCERKNKLIISVFTKEIMLDDFTDRTLDCNECELVGYICKPVVYRKTPFLREISDILLAVNRNYGKSDYLPCIAWGRNARYANSLSVGQKLCLNGRLQSRNYKKVLENGVIEERIAYEVSCSLIYSID